MKHGKRTLWGLSAMALLIGAMLLGTQVYAQQSQPDPYPAQPSAQQPEPQTPSQQPPTSQPPASQQPPDQTGQSPSASGQTADVQVFSGTISKSGDKYVLKETSGKTYDLDHQDMLAAHEGKQVRIKGVLDADGKTIHIQ